MMGKNTAALFNNEINGEGLCPIAMEGHLSGIG